MLLIELLVVWLLPAPRPSFELAYRSGYAAMYYRCEKGVVEWHKKRLETLDHGYAIEQAGRELVAARSRAMEKGIGPADPGYPDIFDFYKPSR